MRSLSAGLIALMVIFAIGDPTAAQTVNRITVGLLSLHSSDHEKAGRIGASAFRAGMQALGYSEGRNFHLHERHADGDVARLPSLAAELLAERVDVIVAVGTDATHAAREVTSSVPIVMAGVGDPVRAQASSSACHIQEETSAAPPSYFRKLLESSWKCSRRLHLPCKRSPSCADIPVLMIGWSKC